MTKIRSTPLLTRPQGCQGCPKSWTTKLKSTLVSWSAKIQPKLNKIQKTFRKQGFVDNFCSILMVFHSFFNFGWILARALTSILTKYQYTYQVSVYWYLYLVFWFSNTDTDTSYFKNVLKYWYFSIVFLISISIFLFIFKELVTINTPILASPGL